MNKIKKSSTKKKMKTLLKQMKQKNTNHRLHNYRCRIKIKKKMIKEGNKKSSRFMNVLTLKKLKILRY